MAHNVPTPEPYTEPTYRCVICPFTTSYEDARRGHESRPGWLGYSEGHATYATATDAAFMTFGEPIDPASVPALVHAGVAVWSYGYGDDPDTYTVIDTDDLWAWPGQTPAAMAQMDDPYVVASWAPFRAAAADIARVLR